MQRFHGADEFGARLRRQLQHFAARRFDCLARYVLLFDRKLALREARMEAALAGFKGPLAEVEFTALTHDWRGEMAAVYATLGLELSPAALAAMDKEQAGATRSAHRMHAGTYRRFARA